VDIYNAAWKDIDHVLGYDLTVGNQHTGDSLVTLQLPDNGAGLFVDNKRDMVGFGDRSDFELADGA